MELKSNKMEPWKRLSSLYLTALILIAFFTVLSQFVIQNALKDMQFDSKIVNLSGRQRFQSQGMVKIVLILTNSEIKLSPEKKKYYLERLERFIRNWDRHHYGIMTGHMPEHNYHTVNSKEINELFTKAHPKYQILSRNINKILDSIDVMPREKALLSRDSILAYEFEFLDIMDNIVYQFDEESKRRVERIKKIEIYILVATFFVLFLEGLFIFWPAVKQIKTSFMKIMDSERHTKFLYDELEKAYNNLKNTELKLAENEMKKLENELFFKKERSLALVMGQENERKRIAKDLHDGLGQSLSAMKLYYERIAKNYSISNAEDSKAYLKMVTDTISEVRNITFNLMPSVLEDFGLPSALQILCKESSVRSGIEIILNTNVGRLKRFDSSIEIGLYRVCQEALNNSIKHSQAETIEVSLNEDNGKLVLIVKDDGIGFNPSQKRKISKSKSGLGIENMKERSSLLGGDFELNSKLKFGTTVKINIPLGQEQSLPLNKFQ